MTGIRIIGGKWRGRKLKLKRDSRIRPTTDRVRETLFNWLAPIIQDAVCLDLFAGSGALGFEALSRGAKKVVMVDKSRITIKNLQTNSEILGAEKVEFICAAFTANWHYRFADKFDIIFLDPPFRQNLLLPALQWLDNCNCLNKKAKIYFEVEKEFDLAKIAPNWKIERERVAGQVRYGLLSDVM